MTNRAALYLRSSKDRSDVSIDAQRRALHETALQRGLVVVEEFADAVESGKDEDRPAFQRLLAQLRSPGRAWEAVLCLDTSRIARRRTIALLFEAEAEKRGVKVVYRNVPDSDPITEMLLRSILQAMDEWHSLTSRQKGLAGMAENVRQGWRAGGRAPRGYRLEYTATGAVRDGAPVTKSRLVLDEETAPTVRAYLTMRAEGVPRGQAILRSRAPWPATSTHSMDWQALTYAGHTVWGIEADTPEGEKRRPRSQWLVTRNTHEALITDEQAEAILGQMERAQQGRRLRASPLLLTGLLVAPDGQAWHSDGCGYYRLGKGKKIGAARLEAAVLEQLEADLQAEESVRLIHQALQGIAGGQDVDGRRLAGLEKRIASLTTNIARTVDLAAQIDDPAPVLRRVTELEQQRAQLVDELAGLRGVKAQQSAASAITDDQVRALLRRLVAEISAAAKENEHQGKARLALAEVLDRIELDAAASSATLHYAVRSEAGDKVATPREDHLTPVRWASKPVPVARRRVA